MTSDIAIAKYEKIKKRQRIRALAFIRINFGNAIADIFQDVTRQDNLQVNLIESKKGVRGIQIELLTRFGERVYYTAQVGEKKVEVDVRVVHPNRERQSSDPNNILFPMVRQARPISAKLEFNKTISGIRKAFKMVLLESIKLTEE